MKVGLFLGCRRRLMPFFVSFKSRVEINRKGKKCVRFLRASSCDLVLRCPITEARDRAGGRGRFILEHRMPRLCGPGHSGERLLCFQALAFRR